MIGRLDLQTGKILLTILYNMDPIKELKNYLKGKSITKAAKELGVSRQTIYNWLNGTHSFTLKNWKKLAKN